MENTFVDTEKQINQPTNPPHKPQLKNKLSMKITLEQVQYTWKQKSPTNSL